MADLNKYEALNGIEFSPEVARLMELFVECWDECKTTDCGECKFRHGKKHYQMMLCLCERYAEKLIANDVAPVRHGRWEIVVGSDGKEHMVCTVCRIQQDLTGVFSYCPNCGANMDKEDT